MFVCMLASAGARGLLRRRLLQFAGNRQLIGHPRSPASPRFWPCFDLLQPLFKSPLQRKRKRTVILILLPHTALAPIELVRTRIAASRDVFGVFCSHLLLQPFAQCAHSGVPLRLLPARASSLAGDRFTSTPLQTAERVVIVLLQ